MGIERKIETNPQNEWRAKSEGPYNWEYDIRPNAAKKKYYIISCDTHLSPTPTLFKDRLDKKWHHRLPRIVVGEDGVRSVVQEGLMPERLVDTPMTGEDLIRNKLGSGSPLHITGDESQVGAQRVADLKADGVDGELIFPNGAALFIWVTNDPEFVDAQCRVWNDFAIETCRDYLDFCNPAAVLPTIDIERSIKEIERVAKLGYRVLTLPCKPHYGESHFDYPNYNWPIYDKLWAAIQDHDLTITYHVATGKDPRGVKKAGGAIINYVVHALAPAIEPIVGMCSAGVLERFPKLRVATIEANAGWVPWMLQAMDESYLKHHMWVHPKMKHMPSDYYRSNCYASFGEDKNAVDFVEQYGLEDNFMWANDYPHHEGMWPHSAAAIERTFGNHLREDTRKKLLGLNAAKAFRFDIPEEYKTGYS